MIGVLARDIQRSDSVWPAGTRVEVIGLSLAHFTVRVGGCARTVSRDSLARVAPSTDWRDQGSCVGADPDLYDSDHPKAAETAAACAGCPVLLDCVVDAVAHPPVGAVQAGAVFAVSGAERALQARELADRHGIPILAPVRSVQDRRESIYRASGAAR